MEISPLQRQLNAAQIPLEKLAGSTQVSETQKIGEISRQFEAVLLRQILSYAQKPMLAKSPESSSTVGSVYQDMVVNTMADQISKSGTFGLSRSLAPQLTHATKSVSDPNSPTLDSNGNR